MSNGQPRPDVPHLTWPARLSGGSLACVEQDTLEEVRQSVDNLLRTPLGARPLAEDYGLADPTFTTGLDVDEVIDQAAEYEPRADIEVTAVDEPDGSISSRIDVNLA